MLLKYAVADVIGLETVLKSQQDKAYNKVVTRTLCDGEASRANITLNLKTFFKPAKRGDVAIAFVSGHGMNTDSGYFFLCTDADPDNIEAEGVSWKAFDPLNDLEPYVLLLVDTCRAGNIVNLAWKEKAAGDAQTFLRKAHNSNIFVMASSSGSAVSMEHSSWGHGAFAKALIDGLSGKASDPEGNVILALFQHYVKKNVLELTQGLQTPVIPKLIGDGKLLELVIARD